MDIMLSIRPQWVEKILNGEKTLEIRKSKPKDKTLPMKCYIYCTTGDALCWNDYTREAYLSRIDYAEMKKWGDVLNRSIVAEFMCDQIFPVNVLANGSIQNWNFYRMPESCVPYGDVVRYIGPGNIGYAWHISDLKIYDKPKPLSKFSYVFTEEPEPMSTPPVSWCYVRPLESE